MLAARVFITIILPQLAPLVMYVFSLLYSCNFSLFLYGFFDW
jgi:hypothetical protein